MDKAGASQTLSVLSGGKLAFASPDASAEYWVQQFGPALADKPKTIQGFVADLYNAGYNHEDPDLQAKILGGTLTAGAHAGEHQSGTFKSIRLWLKKCGFEL